jgi:hypothetical protein
MHHTIHWGRRFRDSNLRDLGRARKQFMREEPRNDSVAPQ